MRKEPWNMEGQRIPPIRDPREKLDRTPEARYVWRKRVRWGDNPSRPFTSPGEPLDRSEVSASKLGSLWRSQCIQLAPVDAEVVAPPAPPARPAELDFGHAVVSLTATGGGWYALHVAEIVSAQDGDGTVYGVGRELHEKVRGFAGILVRAGELGILERVELLGQRQAESGEATVCEVSTEDLAAYGFELAGDRLRARPPTPKEEQPPAGEGDAEDATAEEADEGGEPDSGALLGATGLERAGEGQPAPDGGSGASSVAPADSPPPAPPPPR